MAEHGNLTTVCPRTGDDCHSRALLLEMYDNLAEVDASKILSEAERSRIHRLIFSVNYNAVDRAHELRKKIEAAFSTEGMDERQVCDHTICGTMANFTLIAASSDGLNFTATLRED